MKKNFDRGTQSEHSKETLLKMLVCPLKNMHTSDSIYRVHQQDVVCISQTRTTLSPPPSNLHENMESLIFSLDFWPHVLVLVPHSCPCAVRGRQLDCAASAA